MVRVTVNTLTDVMTFELADSWTRDDVLRKVAKQTGTPAAFYEMVSVEDATDSASDYTFAVVVRSPLNPTFCTVERIIKELNRLHQFNDAKGNALAITFILKCLDIDDPDVRIKALSLLGAFAEEDDETAIGAICERLFDDEFTQLAAIKALRRCDKKGSEDAVRSLGALIELKGTQFKVRVHAVDALLGFEGFSCADTKKPIFLKICSDAMNNKEDHGIREVASQAYTKLERKDSETVISLLCDFLKHNSSGVRRSALQTLTKIGTHVDVKTAGSIIECLRDQIPETRDAAIEALAKVVARGDERVVESLVHLLSDRSAATRMAALRALVHVDTKDHVITIASQCLEDTDYEMRKVATQALVSIATGDDQGIILAIKDRLQHGSANARRAALQVLASVSFESEDSIIDIVLAILKDTDQPLVREAALQALATVVNTGYRDTIVDYVIVCLKDENFKIRRCAVQVLVAIAEKGNKMVLDALESCEDDADWWVRKHVMQAKDDLS